MSQFTGYFASKALTDEPSIVDCKLSEGHVGKCFAFTVGGQPVDHTVGKFCPKNISETGKDAGGIWLENKQVHQVDGPFIAKLADFYEDSKWQLFNPESGAIQVTDTEESCKGAAKPNVEEAYYNHCVECKLEYMTKSTERTYVLPVQPTIAATPKPVTDGFGTGVAFNGVRIDGPAPKENILAAYTIAPFDDCGGHINLHVGYHYHAHGGCSTEVSSEFSGHAPIIGFAMDGYLLYSRFDADGSEPSDLDSCRGHEAEGLGYHYHVNDSGQNQILPCHTGQIGCTNSGTDTTCDATTAVSHAPPRRLGKK
jgi:hypothetical protein